MSTLDTVMSANSNLLKIETNPGPQTNNQNYAADNAFIVCSAGRLSNNALIKIKNRVTIVGFYSESFNGKIEARKVEHFYSYQGLFSDVEQFIKGKDPKGRTAVDACEILFQYFAIEPKSGKAYSLILDAILTGEITEAPIFKLVNIMHAAFRFSGDKASLKAGFLNFLSRFPIIDDFNPQPDILEDLIKFLVETVQPEEMNQQFKDNLGSMYYILYYLYADPDFRKTLDPENKLRVATKEEITNFIEKAYFYNKDEAVIRKALADRLALLTDFISEDPSKDMRTKQRECYELSQRAFNLDPDNEIVRRIHCHISIVTAADYMLGNGKDIGKTEKDGEELLDKALDIEPENGKSRATLLKILLSYDQDQVIQSKLFYLLQTVFRLSNGNSDLKPFFLSLFSKKAMGEDTIVQLDILEKMIEYIEKTISTAEMNVQFKENLSFLILFLVAQTTEMKKEENPEIRKLVRELSDDEMISLMEKSHKYDPKSDTVSECLAVLYVSVASKYISNRVPEKTKADAIVLLKKATEIDASNEDATNLLKNLKEL